MTTANPSARKAAKRAATSATAVVRCGTKRVAVGYWSSADGWECYGDDWSPTACYGRAGGEYAAVLWDGMVKASILQWSNGRWKVSVWGGDDYGLERETDDGELARRLFDRINHLVTIADLYQWGFRPS